MAVKYYVGRDSQKQPWPPDFSHETHATIGIIKRLWQAFNREKDLFAIVVNLHRPSADMVIISKRGLGVVELKHYPGRIFQKPDGTWCAGSTPIKAGAKSQGYRNPHEQVQAYAKRIRRALILSRKQPPLLPGDSTDWERFKFQTAVCFTHPSAIIEDFKEALRHRQRPKTEKWEEFKVRKPDEMPEWTTTLRFEASMGHEHDYEPHCLTAEQIMNIATRLLHGTEWTEIANLMPTVEPYAHLIRLEKDHQVQVVALDREEVCLGRDAHICAVSIPERFTLVSRDHARITRTPQGVFIEDKSKNGICIDGQRIPEGKTRQLRHGQRITLGGKEPGDKVPQLEFSQKTVFKPGLTETDPQPG